MRDVRLGGGRRQKGLDPVDLPLEILWIYSSLRTEGVDSMTFDLMTFKVECFTLL